MKSIKRRTFVSAAVLIPLHSLLSTRAIADENLSEEDPMAMALGYKMTSEVAEQKCSNCQLYQGQDGDQVGACAIFPGKLVAADGWCKSWVVKAG